MNFKEWKIKSKLVLSIILSIVLFLIMGLTAILSTGRVYKNADYIVINSLPSVDAAHTINTVTSDYAISQYRHIITEDKTEMAKEEKIMETLNKQIQETIQKYNKDLISNDEDKKLINTVNQKWNDYLAVSQQVTELSRNLKTQEAMKLMTEKGMPSFNQASDALLELVTFNQKLANDNSNSLKATYNTTKIASIAFLGIGISALVIVNLLVLFSIVKPLTLNSNKLDEATRMITSASAQLSSSSQQLAGASTEQAASIEEVSATMDESSSMVKQSTENTKQAAFLASDTNEAANNASSEMNGLMSAVEEIIRSSDQISKIIKVIDEIAFQTNILALNAAVEAARAGDAGKGFAVVAEEVRNLAQRSANAAKDTASIIEKNIQLSNRGGESVSRVNEALKNISLKVDKLNNLIAEITAASQEQAQGIGQVNTAITQMEAVTQQNAAVAEESASAAEELNAQAETLENIVDSLTMMVNGSASIQNSNNNYRKRSISNNTFSSNATPKFVAKNSPKFKSSAKKRNNVVKPEEVIPFDEDDEF